MNNMYKLRWIGVKWSKEIEQQKQFRIYETAFMINTTVSISICFPHQCKVQMQPVSPFLWILNLVLRVSCPNKAYWLHSIWYRWNKEVEIAKKRAQEGMGLEMTAECLSVMGEERVRHTITYSGFSWRIKTNGGAFLALALLFTLSSWLAGWLPAEPPLLCLLLTILALLPHTPPRCLPAWTAPLIHLLASSWNQAWGSLFSRSLLNFLALLPCLAPLPTRPYTLPAQPTLLPLFKQLPTTTMQLEGRVVQAARQVSSGLSLLALLPSSHFYLLTLLALFYPLDPLSTPTRTATLFNPSLSSPLLPTLFS